MVSRKPLRNDENDDGLETPFGQTFDPDPAEKPDPLKAADARVSKLEEEIAKLHEQLETRESRDFTIMAQPVIQQETFQPEPFVTVPDVNTDLDGYIAARTENALRADRNERRKAETASKNSKSLDEKVEDLWSEFGEQYPDFEDVPQERIEFVASTVAKRAMRRGLDPQRYMFVTRDRFLKDVANEYSKIFGDPSEDENDVEDEPPVSRRATSRGKPRRDARRRSSQDEDPGRTNGLFGGSGSGNRMSSREVSGDDAGSMLEDIYAIQKRGGFL